MTLEEVFALKTTENGDLAFNSTLNPMLDILFMAEYYTKHPNEMPELQDDEISRLFALFMRDPRKGMGYKEIGRNLFSKLYNVTLADIVKAGRFDDLWRTFSEKADRTFWLAALNYLYNEIVAGNELAKKWMPRFSSKDKKVAQRIARQWNMSKKEYGHFIKADTTEQKLSRKNTESINFSHVPSLAMLKYYNRFCKGEDTKERFAKFIADVKSGKAKINTSVTNVYDIYKHRNDEGFEPEMFFEQIEKTSGSWIPVVDTSGSMENCNDSIGKAYAIGHYLAKTSTYCPNKVVTFSSKPTLLELGKENTYTISYGWTNSTETHKQDLSRYAEGSYNREIESMWTGDCSNTDLGAVMNLLKNLKQDAPEFVVILSDMEFDRGSSVAKDELMAQWRELSIPTKIVWWNLNDGRSKTVPETDKYGNIFMTGYNPNLLKYLECGFNGQEFLMKLLKEYQKYFDGIEG